MVLRTFCAPRVEQIREMFMDIFTWELGYLNFSFEAAFYQQSAVDAAFRASPPSVFSLATRSLLAIVIFTCNFYFLQSTIQQHNPACLQRNGKSWTQAFRGVLRSGVNLVRMSNLRAWNHPWIMATYLPVMMEIPILESRKERFVQYDPLSDRL
jgi:hypothetical protein